MEHKRCANCGFLNPSFKFCGECGASLSDAPDISEASAVDTPAVEATLTHGAERRQLTVLFCDIVDSTAFTERLDPEELRNLLEVYRTCVMEVVLAQNGHIARYFGDGILVYFGYPIAHEDAAHRAVRAALGIVAAMETLKPYLHTTFGVEISVRLSIDTGLVVVWHISDEGSPEAIDIVGKTPNLAARMQKLAAPNNIVIGETTHQLVEGFFKCEPLGAAPLRGISQPVNIYQVSGEIPVQSRLDIASESGLTPFIGRDQEVERLKQGWAQVLASKGQTLLIEGEAGIGKSRCVQVIQEYVNRHPEAVIIEGRCSPYYQNSPLYSILSLFQEHIVQFTNADTPEMRLDKLENLLRDYSVPTLGSENSDNEAQANTTQTLSLLAELLEIPFEIQRQTETGIDLQRVWGLGPIGNVRLWQTETSIGTQPYIRLIEQNPYPSGWGGRQRRQQTLEVLVQVLLKMAEQKPILFVLEDLHWIDPSSIEFLTRLISQIENSRIFTILSSRSNVQTLRSNEQFQDGPERNAGGSALDREALAELLRPEWASTLPLSALTPAESETMIQHVAGDTPLSPDLLKRIVGMTEGVPLFVEELTQMVLESGALSLIADVSDQTTLHSQATDIPVTLQDLLTARLDELGPAKEIVQLGATLGREWTGELLYKVASGIHLENNTAVDLTSLKRQLSELVDAYILNRNETSDNQVRYTFRHPLLRETAYQSLLRSRRQQYHQQIAEVLQDSSGNIGDGFQPELVAYHYTEAGLPEKAIHYWQHAGHRALERSANIESVRHIRQGLAALEQLSENTGIQDLEATAQLELELQTTLGTALIATKGYASEEVEVAYTRAYQLLDTLEARELAPSEGSEFSTETGLKDLRFPVLFGLWLSHLVRGRLLSAREFGEQCFTIAKQVGDPAFEVEARRALGATLYYLSEFRAAWEHLEAGIELYQPQHHPVPTFLHYVADPGMTLLSYSAPLLWCLGYPTQAESRLYEAAAIGKDRNHPFSDAVLLHFKTVLYQYEGNVENVNIAATEMLTISQEHGFSGWEATAMVMKGWVLAEQNNSEEGIAMICKGIAAWEKTRAEVLLPLFFALLAQAYQRAGQHNLALKTLDSALSAVDRTGERTYAAELSRQQGELYLMLSKKTKTSNEESTTQQAEDAFQNALTIARQQSAKSWELRAALSLCELWMTQNRYQDAYTLLEPIYTWFTEGFDTKDLKRAKNLLEVLEAKNQS